MLFATGIVTRERRDSFLCLYDMILSLYLVDVNE